MSWRIAADAREIFVDLVATSQKEAYFVRTLNRRDQLLAGFSEALSQLPQEASEAIKSGTAHLSITSDFERVALGEHWGSNAALITTEGFENLLGIGTQQRKNLFGLNAEKSTPFISKDFSFGVTERTHTNGTVEKTIDQDEINVIVSKLELSEVKYVGICFINSKKNPQNEKVLAEILKSKGLNVFCSYLEEGYELERAEKVSQKAFLASTHLETLEKLKNLGFKEENIFLTAERPAFRQSSPQNSLYIEFFEDRILIRNEKLHKELDISPLSLMELDNGGLIHVGPGSVSSEPGPVVMGKGLQLTVFDLLAFRSALSCADMPRLKLDGTKILRQLAPLAQNLRIAPESCAEKSLNLFIESIALEIEGAVKTPISILVAGGWLASNLGPMVARRLGVHKIFIPPHASWLSCLQLLEGGIEKGVAVKKIGNFSLDLPGSLGEGEIHDL